jgi:hypothetical protein
MEAKKRQEAAAQEHAPGTDGAAANSATTNGSDEKSRDHEIEKA